MSENKVAVIGVKESQEDLERLNALASTYDLQLVFALNFIDFLSQNKVSDENKLIGLIILGNEINSPLVEAAISAHGTNEEIPVFKKPAFSGESMNVVYADISRFMAKLKN